MEDDTTPEPVDMWADERARPVQPSAAQRNPYDIALTVLWIIGLAVGTVLLLAGFATSSSGFREQQASSHGFLQVGVIFLGAGALFLAAHLASLATRWSVGR